MDNKKIKYITIGIVVLFIFIIVVLLITRKEKVYDDLSLYEVEYNNKIDNEVGMKLYNSYQVEEGLLFNFVGSNGFDGYYGDFYKDNMKELPSFLKNIITINNGDYGTWNYDTTRSCYRISLDNYNNLYNNLFGNIDNDLNFDNIDNKIIVDDNSICVSDNIRSNYTKVIDTYLVDIKNRDDKVEVYEKVIFIEIKDDYVYFYKDQEHKDLIDKLKNNEQMDTSFINNSEVVSKVMINNLDRLNTYKYTYVKEGDNYYLESIKK